MTSQIVPLVEGFVLGAGLIVGIGPQNALVLRQGLRRQHLLAVVLVCTLVDAGLIGLGAAGVGVVFQGEAALRWVSLLGAAVLLGYGACSLRAALAPKAWAQEAAGLPCKQVVLGLLAVTLLNPSLYVDTLLLIGGGAGRYAGDLRVWFALGAVAASLVWFAGLGYGSALLAPWLRRPNVLRGIDLLSAGVLWLMALRLIGAV